MNHSKAYYIYSNMLNAVDKTDINEELTFNCKSEQNEIFYFLAAELAKLDVQNPLQPDQDGYAELEDLKFFYGMWPDNKPECAFKKRFLLSAYRLCKLCPENIFEDEQDIETVSLDELAEQEHEETEQEDIDTGTYVPVGEPTIHEEENHVLGVLPFETDDDHYLDDYEEKPKKTKWPFKKNKKR